MLWCLDLRSWTNSICTTWDNESRLTDQNWSNLKNISKRKKRSRTKCSFVCCLFCRTIWQCFISFLNRWQKWISRRSCKRWTSIFLERCAENMHCSKFKRWFERTWRSLSIMSREIWRCTICEISRHLCRFHLEHRCRYHCRCHFFFFACCFDRFDCFDLINRDFVWDENVCFDIRSSRDNCVYNECNVSFEWWRHSWFRKRRTKKYWRWLSWTRLIRRKRSDWRKYSKIYWSRNWFSLRDWIQQTRCRASEHNVFDIAHISRRNRNESIKSRCYHWWTLRRSFFVCFTTFFWNVARNQWRFDWWLKWWFTIQWTNYLIFFSHELNDFLKICHALITLISFFRKFRSLHFNRFRMIVIVLRLSILKFLIFFNVDDTTKTLKISSIEISTIRIIEFESSSTLT